MRGRAVATGLLCVPALLPLTVLAQQIPKRYTVLGAEYGIESLDNPSPNWTQSTLSAARFGTLHRSLYGEWRRLQRFNVADNQLVMGGYAPMGRRLGVTLEGSFSQDHRLVPENSVSADLDLSLNDGWVAHLGGKQSHFSEEDTTAVHAGFELYRGAWRLSYTLAHGRLQSGDSGNSHVVQYDWYYGESNRIGLSLASGGEPTRIDPSKVIVTDVRSAALAGRHWFGPEWGISYVLGWTEQGDFYIRRGGSLGLLFRF